VCGHVCVGVGVGVWVWVYMCVLPTGLLSCKIRAGENCVSLDIEKLVTTLMCTSCMHGLRQPYVQERWNCHCHHFPSLTFTCGSACAISSQICAMSAHDTHAHGTFHSTQRASVLKPA